MSNILQIRRGTAAEWTAADPILYAGEQGFETDTKKMKIGDGATAWTLLGYYISDGNAGANILTDLADVVITTPADEDHLVYDTVTSKWINEPTTAPAIGGLSDVTITTPVTGNILRYDGADWVNAAPLLPGTVVQTLHGTIAAASGTTVIPYDATVPLVTEGTQMGTAPFTLSNAANDVHVKFSCVVEGSNNGSDIVLAVFRDSTCIAAYPVKVASGSASIAVSFELSDLPADTAAHTYTGRIGISTGTWRINNPSGGNLGGKVVPGSIFQLQELV